jgi:chromosome segregation ATPase
MNGKNDLPADRLKTVEAGLLYHQQVQAELDEARRANSTLGDEIAHHKIEIEGLNARINTLLSEIQTYRAERDAAVRHAERIGTAVESMHAIFAMISQQEEELPSISLESIEVTNGSP